MPITRYHSLTGAQGRGIGGGYQGTRYESPISTFVSRPVMPQSAEVADMPARKAVEDAPPPTAVVDQQAASGAGTPEFSPEYSPSSEFESEMDRIASSRFDPVDRIANIGVNTATSAILGAPLDAALKGGLQASIAPAAFLSDAIDLGKTAVAKNQVMGAYGDMLEGAPATGYRNLSALESEQYSPAPENLSEYSAFKDASTEMTNRTADLAPSLSPPAKGQILTALLGGREQTIFGPVKSADKYRGLLGASGQQGAEQGGGGMVGPAGLGPSSMDAAAMGGPPGRGDLGNVGMGTGPTDSAPTQGLGYGNETEGHERGALW